MEYKIIVGQTDITRKPHEKIIAITDTLEEAEAQLKTRDFSAYTKEGYTYAAILPDGWSEIKFGSARGLIVRSIGKRENRDDNAK